MVSEELIANCRQNMLDTLADLSSFDRQRDYAAAVPYVHIPTELVCQWDEHSHLLHEESWFRESLSPAELTALLTFDETMNSLVRLIGRELPDLDQLWADNRWKQLANAAARTLDLIS